MQTHARTLIGVVLSTLVVVSTAVAGPLEDGVAAYDRRDYATAIRILRPLADQGDVTAQFNLGNMYAKGEGVPQNYVEALKWFQKAADQGHATAQYSIGTSYDYGLGVPQNYAEAFNWYRRAADQGVAAAQFNLGNMYAKGEGVPQNYVQAHMWFNLSAANPAFDKKLRDSAVKDRDLAASKMTPAQIAEAQKLASEWKPKPDR